MLEAGTFAEIAAILGMSTLIGLIGQKLRQPLVIMFLATGIIAGPAVLGYIHSFEQIELLANIGISILLFIVGLKLDVKLIKTTGPVALATGLGQIVFTSVIGFAIALAMGISPLSAGYVAVALTFSSTIIIVKLLSEKKEIDSLHGQIAIGFLIVQDIAAILALVGLTAFGSSLESVGSPYISIFLLIIKGLAFLAGIALITKFVIPYLTRLLSRSMELLTLFAIAWAVILGAGSDWLGFSKEVGAFLAGISLASTDYKDSIGSRLTGIRDFLLLFFFISLGSRLDLSMVSDQIFPSLAFSLFVLIGNPLIVLIIMGLMGYRRRTGFLAGLTVAQISEFSLIVAALGLSLGHITDQIMGLITLVGIITIFTSTYMILYSGKLYRLLSKPLRVFEKKDAYREAAISTADTKGTDEMILAGLGSYGSGLMEYLLRRNKKVLCIDFDPSTLEKWRKQGVSVLYGDITNSELYDQIALDRILWFISTIRSKKINLSVIENLKARNYRNRIALTADSEQDAQELSRAGAHIILRPFADASEQAADTLTHAIDFLPGNISWPISFLQVRIRSDASIAGSTIRDIPLSSSGISILAVSRGGEVFYDPKPDFRIFPADILLIMGPPLALKDAEFILNQYREPEGGNRKDSFDIAEVGISPGSDIAGMTVAGIQFRQKYGVTLAGIRRDGKQITAISPSEKLNEGDCLIVLGKSSAVSALKNKAPL